MTPFRPLAQFIRRAVTAVASLAPVASLVRAEITRRTVAEIRKVASFFARVVVLPRSRLVKATVMAYVVATTFAITVTTAHAQETASEAYDACLIAAVEAADERAEAGDGNKLTRFIEFVGDVIACTRDWLEAVAG